MRGNKSGMRGSEVRKSEKKRKVRNEEKEREGGVIKGRRKERKKEREVEGGT